MKKWIGIIILIIIFSTITFFIGRQIGLNTDTSNTVTTISNETVERHTIQKTLTYSGEIQSANTENVALDTTKYFEMMCVEEDDTVEEGENIVKYTDGTYLVAPYDCVISSYSVPEASSICTSSNYIQIQDLENLSTTISISENDISEVTEGDSVEIVLSSDETKTYTGTITKIDSVGQYATSGTTFSGTVEFTNDGDAKIGMTVSLTVIIEEATDVVAVPIEAVTTEDDKNYVTVINNGTAEEVEVEIGIADDEYVEIKSGLEEGDTIQITTTTTQSTIRSTESSQEDETGGFGDMGGGGDAGGMQGGQGGDMQAPSMDGNGESPMQMPN